MLGHRADSQTVCRFSLRKSRFSRCTDSKCVSPLRNQAGRRGREAGDNSSKDTKDTSIFFYESGFEADGLEVDFGFRYRCLVSQRANQYTEKRIRGTRGNQRRE